MIYYYIGQVATDSGGQDFCDSYYCIELGKTVEIPFHASSAFRNSHTIISTQEYINFCDMDKYGFIVENDIARFCLNGFIDYKELFIKNGISILEHGPKLDFHCFDRKWQFLVKNGRLMNLLDKRCDLYENEVSSIDLVKIKDQIELYKLKYYYLWREKLWTVGIKLKK